MTHAKVHQRTRYPGSVDARLRGPFTPADVDDLLAWWDFSALALSNNDPIASASNLAGASHALSQSTEAQRPLFKTNVKNGRAAALWDTTPNDSFAIGHSMALGTAHTFIVVARMPAASWANMMFLGQSGSQYELYYASNGTTIYPASHGGYDAQSHGCALNTWYILTLTRSSTSYTLYRNATAVTTTGSTGASAFSPSHLGQFGTGGYCLRDVYIGEALIYSRAITADERGLIVASLNAKWSVY